MCEVTYDFKQRLKRRCTCMFTALLTTLLARAAHQAIRPAGLHTHVPERRTVAWHLGTCCGVLLTPDTAAPVHTKLGPCSFATDSCHQSWHPLRLSPPFSRAYSGAEVYWFTPELFTMACRRSLRAMGIRAAIMACR